MKHFLFFISIILMAGCSNRQPVSVESQGDYELSLLFEKGGCKVYRFVDKGNYIYWSDCSGRFSYETGGKHSKDIQTDISE